jgi:hypothetical protein
VPPADRFVPRYAAEPPQDLLPYGRWAATLREEFLAACLRIDAEGEDLGEPGSLVWCPDRTWSGRTYVPVTSTTTTGFELYGHVSYVPDPDGGAPADFQAGADFTAETADANPDWKLDLCDEVIGGWRGEQGKVAAMTLVWGIPLVPGGVVVTAELGGIAVDQCTLVEDRFTLIAPDNYRGDYLDITLWNARGEELAAESLYVEDDDEEEEPEEAG